MPQGSSTLLTAEQETKLRELWQLIFMLFDQPETIESTLVATTEATEGSQQKVHLRLPRWTAGEIKTEPCEPELGPLQVALNTLKETIFRNGNKPEMQNELEQCLSRRTLQYSRKMVLGVFNHEHPDAFLLRFLRARKWVVDDAFTMVVLAMNWRYSKARVDDIMKYGEEYAIRDSDQGEILDPVLSQDFMKQIRMGKSFLHGTDKKGRPIWYLRVRLHRSTDQCTESIERYTIYLIETCRMLMTPPSDTMTLVYDMTGFTMANMDYIVLKFLITLFEANYPECLGAVLMHNPPWIFKGIWKLIHGWLDPVVAGKVHFTYGTEGLTEFINPANLVKELGGDNDWVYRYVEPTEGENNKMHDTKTRDRLLAAREKLADQFEAATRKWILHPQIREVRSSRLKLALELQRQYCTIDPYVRCHSLYDRIGDIQIRCGSYECIADEAERDGE